VTTKILASADFHLGMRFSGYPELQGQLAEARFLALARLVEIGNEEQCSLFVIAGDLFHRVNVSQKEIERAAGLLNGFQGELVAVLPGNHDFSAGTEGTLWSRFKKHAGDRVLLLDSARPYDLDHYNLDIRLYPGPCDSKHSSANAISWLAASWASGASGVRPSGVRPPGAALHIGVAHGSIEGISPDHQGVYFPMKRSELDDAGLDLWIVGHTHRQHPAPREAKNKRETPKKKILLGEDNLLIPGTPEADGFDCRHRGTAWLIEVGENKRIEATSLTTGTYRFLQEEVQLDEEADVDRLERRLRSEELAETLLRLTLKGRLPADAFARLPHIIKEAEDSLLWAEIDDGQVMERIDADTVEAQFTKGSFPYRLLKRLLDEDDTEALQTAYDLLQEGRR
jgi:exonuclease SbcD